MPNGFRGEIHFFALFCEKLIKKPCLLIVQNQFHGMFVRFDADIAVISAVFAVQSPGNLLVGLDDDAVGLDAEGTSHVLVAAGRADRTADFGLCDPPASAGTQ